MNLVFRAGFFARIFAGATGDRYTLVDGNFQRTSEAGVTVLLHPPHRLSPIRLTPGGIWSAIEVDTAEGPVVMRGMPSIAALQWHSALMDWRRPATERRVAELLAPVKAALVRLSQPFDATRFIRRSEFDALLSECSAARAGIDAEDFAAVASDAERGLLDSLARGTAAAPAVRDRANELFVERAIAEHAALFDTIEKSPLTASQRRACVVDDDHNLVLAGAGTGKTSVMIGRAAYLIASGIAAASEILLIAFNAKAAEELRERLVSLQRAGLSSEALTAKTFHALGKEIIAEVEGVQPAVSVLATDDHALRRFISDALEELLKDASYLEAFIGYGFQRGQPFRTMFDFDTRADYEKHVEGLELRALSGDLVKSHEELKIANELVRLGIEFEYERPFQDDTATRQFRRYEPDFTIQVGDVEPAFGTDQLPSVVYLEHFALSAAGSAPLWFHGYLEGVAWKRKLHADAGTVLIETQSHEFRSGLLPGALGPRLAAAGVPLKPRTGDQCIALLREKGVVLEVAETFQKLIRLARELGIRGSIATTLAKLEGEDRARAELLWRLLEPVLARYEAELASRRELDFPEMIHRAVAYVRQGRYRSPFRRILVDEFQDISEARANLVRALKAATAESTLFCVGDDWQSIYRFLGSDVRFASEFETKIGPGSRTDLDCTFRFNDRIGEAATSFVRRNPDQTQRRLLSTRNVDKAAVSLVPTAEPARAVDAILDRVATFAARRQTVFEILVLARYRYELDAIRKDLEGMAAQTRPAVRIRLATVHESKGTEADIVVLVGLQSGLNGFPAEKPLDPFEEAFLPPRETYPSAEERRLFYVALTRARHRVYLVYDRYQCSAFVAELAAMPQLTVRDEMSGSFIQTASPLVPCPRCMIGLLVERAGDGGRFYGCSRFPACSYTEGGCRTCGGLLIRVDGHRVCSREGCPGVQVECPRCGSPMEIRNSKRGSFFGCSKYGRLDPQEQCSEIERLRPLPGAETLLAKYRRTAPNL